MKKVKGCLSFQGAVVLVVLGGRRFSMSPFLSLYYFLCRAVVLRRREESEAEANVKRGQQKWG